MSGMTVQEEIIAALRQMMKVSGTPATLQEMMEWPIAKFGGDSWAEVLGTRDEAFLRRELAQLKDTLP